MTFRYQNEVLERDLFKVNGEDAKTAVGRDTVAIVTLLPQNVHFNRSYQSNGYVDQRWGQVSEYIITLIQDTTENHDTIATTLFCEGTGTARLSKLTS